MGSFINTGVEKPFGVVLNGTNVYSEALKSVSEVLDKINSKNVLDLENGVTLEDFEYRLFRVVGSDGIYSYTFGVSYDVATNTFTIDFLERLLGDEPVTIIPVPPIPDPFTGDTKTEALAARDAFFVQYPSLLTNLLTVNIEYGTVEPFTQETYIYSTSANKWAIVI